MKAYQTENYSKFPFQRSVLPLNTFSDKLFIGLFSWQITNMTLHVSFYICLLLSCPTSIKLNIWWSLIRQNCWIASCVFLLKSCWRNNLNCKIHCVEMIHYILSLASFWNKNSFDIKYKYSFQIIYCVSDFYICNKKIKSSSMNTVTFLTLMDRNISINSWE